MVANQLFHEWIRALESDEYAQTNDMLRNKDDNGFCCLGVLCDVIDPNGWSGDTSVIGHGNAHYWRKPGITWRLDKEQCDLLHMSDSEMHDLMGANDAGHSFKQIANLARLYAGFAPGNHDLDRNLNFEADPYFFRIHTW